VSYPRVLGVDACRAGWIGIALSAGDRGDTAVRGYLSAEIEALAAQATADGPVAVIGIDMPIGLADTGQRQADVLGRAAAGPRWASVFSTPVRTALATGDYAAALAENRRLGGGGISSQAFALRGKIAQVDRWLRDGGPAGITIVEVHPELSFAAMAGAPLPDSKATWSGLAIRRQLLASHGLAVPDDLGPPGRKAGPDDVLDAAAAAWTARRLAIGQARCLPDPPERFSDGIDCAIWT
jgi:predicted RNase H-like nuclease